MSDIVIVKNPPLSQLMKSPVITLLLSDPFSAAYEKMENHRIRHLPVVDNQGVLVGILTQRDLFRAHPPRETENGWVYDKAELNRYALEHFMTKDPVTLTPDHKLSAALDIFVRDKFGSIPLVTADKKLAGILSHSDALRFFLKAFSV